MKWSTAQDKAIQTRNVNLVVSAGAGSGKTAVLIERIVSLLEEEPDLRVDQILVMTFTEAAAGEMRQRLAIALESRIEQALESGETTKARRLQREIDGLWRAQISTIHSFCLQLLRDNLFSLDVSPDFRLLGGNEDEVRLVAQAKATIEDALNQSEARAVEEMMLHLRLADIRKLTQVVLRTYALVRSQESPHVWLKQAAQAYPTSAVPLSETRFFNVFQSYVETQLDMSVRAFTTGLERALAVPELESYATWLQDAVVIVKDAQKHGASQAFNIEMMVAELSRFGGLSNPKTSYKGDEADEVKAFRKEGKAELDAILPMLKRGEAALVEDLCALSPSIRTLSSLIEQFMDDVEAKKRRDNVMDFGDLEHVAYHLLKRRGSELARVQDVFRHVFVDEYQDTSPIQDAIVDLVTESRNNLFAVGDVKQSIYRFRMAEPGLFLRRYGRYQHHDGGDIVDLAENYRSRPEIVDFVNFVFTQLFSEETTDFAYDDHARMVSRATYPDAVHRAPMIEVQFVDRASQLNTEGDSGATNDAADNVADGDEDESGMDATAIEREARMVANRLSQMLFTDPIEVWDKEAQRMRPLRPGDVAILLRSGRTALNTVLDALQAASIPATANTSTGFYEALEVKWLLAVLSVIDNPRDDLALITALRSPLFGFDETMLAEIRLARSGAFFDALYACSKNGRRSAPNVTANVQHEDAGIVQGTETDSSLVTAIESFYRQFRQWRQFAKASLVSEVLNQVMADTEFLRYVEGMSRGAVRRANVEKLLAMARQYDAESSEAGLYGFLANWRAHDEANLDFGVAAEATADAVQVMTIHRSKGLEFPVVFVMDLGKQFRLSQDLVYLHRDLGFGAVEYHPSTQQRWRTVSSIACTQAERKSALAEEARILYVALTRAREHLILVGSTRNLEQAISRAAGAHDLTSGSLLAGWFMRAKSYMDWLLPIVLRHPEARDMHQFLGADTWDGHVFEAGGEAWSKSVQVSLHNLDEVSVGVCPDHVNEAEVDFDAWLEEASIHTPQSDLIRIVSEGDARAQALFAKVSATDMRRLHVGLQNAHSNRSSLPSSAAASLLDNPVFAASAAVTPREQGILFHTFMQRCRLPVGQTEKEVEREIQRLLHINQLREEDVASLNVQQLVGFFQSDLGQRLQAAETIYREQPFFHRIDVPGEHGQTFPVVAQGVIDCLFEEEHQWVVVDYKTDRVDVAGVRMKAKEYEAQVATYLAALSPLKKTKSVRAYLYFVHAETTVEIKSMSLSSIFVELMRRRSKDGVFR